MAKSSVRQTSDVSRIMPTLKLQKVSLLHVPHATFTHTVSQLLGELHRSGLVSIFACVLGDLGSHFNVIMLVFAMFLLHLRPYLLHAPIFHRCTRTWVITTWQQKGRPFSFMTPFSNLLTTWHTTAHA